MSKSDRVRKDFTEEASWELYQRIKRTHQWIACMCVCTCTCIWKSMLHRGEKEEAFWVERTAQFPYSNLREHMFGNAWDSGFKVSSRRGR